MKASSESGECASLICSVFVVAWDVGIRLPHSLRRSFGDNYLRSGRALVNRLAQTEGLMRQPPSYTANCSRARRKTSIFGCALPCLSRGQVQSRRVWWHEETVLRLRLAAEGRVIDCGNRPVFISS